MKSPHNNNNMFDAFGGLIQTQPAANNNSFDAFGGPVQQQPQSVPVNFEVNMVAPPAPPVQEEKMEPEPPTGMSGGDISAFDELAIDTHLSSSVSVSSDIDSDTVAVTVTVENNLFDSSTTPTATSLATRQNPGNRHAKSSPQCMEEELSIAVTSSAGTDVSLSSGMRKGPIPSPSLRNKSSSTHSVTSTSKGAITAPKKAPSAAVPSPITGRPASLTLTRGDGAHGLRPSRSKSVHVNILQSAFISDEVSDSGLNDRQSESSLKSHGTVADISRRSAERSVQEDVSKSQFPPRGVVPVCRSKNGKSFSRPRSLSQKLPKSEQDEEGEGRGICIYPSPPDSQRSDTSRGGVFPHERSGVRDITQSDDKRGVFQEYSLVEEQDGKEEQNQNQMQNMTNDEKMKVLLKMNVLDDVDYALENERVDSAAYRPVSRNCGHGIFSGTRQDSFQLKYASDSTDTDDDNNDDDDEEGGGVDDKDSIEMASIAWLEGGGRESEGVGGNSSISPIDCAGKGRRSSSKKKSKRVENRAANISPKRGDKKKTKKAKLLRRAAALEKKKASASASAAVTIATSSLDGGSRQSSSAPMTEREKSVARYRATLERIDRKLQKEGVGEVVKCVDGKERMLFV